MGFSGLRIEFHRFSYRSPKRRDISLPESNIPSRELIRRALFVRKLLHSCRGSADFFRRCREFSESYEGFAIGGVLLQDCKEFPPRLGNLVDRPVDARQAQTILRVLRCQLLHPFEKWSRSERSAFVQPDRP